MRAIIVDDEALAVQYLTKVLADIELTDLIASYTSSIIAKEEIVAKNPDVVFLDIEMPKLNGIELGKYIRSKLPDVKIIFTTSFEKYAIEAIDIGNIDYILKPFEPKEIAEKLNKIPRKQSLFPMVCLFGELRFIHYKKGQSIDEAKVIEGKWRTRLTRDIFIYMMNIRETHIRKDILIETFWPELPPKEGYNILYATIHYMRRFLKEINFPIEIENTDEYYRLNLNDVLVDVDYWLNKVEELKDPTDKDFEKLTDIYRNHYLAEETYFWAEYNRQRYRIKWLEIVRCALEELEKQKDYTTAILYALKYQDIEPYMEENYFILMKLFAKTRDYQSVKQQYERLTKMMQAEYNDLPAKEIVDWYNKWKKLLA